MKKLHARTLGLAVAAGAVTAALPLTAQLRDVVQNPYIIDVPGHPADSAGIGISFEAQQARFVALPPFAQGWLTAFLRSLVLFGSDDTASNLLPAAPATPGRTKIAPPAPRASTRKWISVNVW